VPLRQDFERDGSEHPHQPVAVECTAALVREVHALDANLALYEMITLQEQVKRSTSPQLVAVLVSILVGWRFFSRVACTRHVLHVAQSTRNLDCACTWSWRGNLCRLVISRGLRLTQERLFGATAALALTKLLDSFSIMSARTIRWYSFGAGCDERLLRSQLVYACLAASRPIPPRIRIDLPSPMCGGRLF